MHAVGRGWGWGGEVSREDTSSSIFLKSLFLASSLAFSSFSCKWKKKIEDK
jgi:hypothetical protein